MKQEDRKLETRLAPADLMLIPTKFMKNLHLVPSDRGVQNHPRTLTPCTSPAATFIGPNKKASGNECADVYKSK